MTVKRIHAVPPPAFPPHAMPLYALPAADVIYSPRSLSILRGGVTLGIPATITAERDVDLKNDSTKDDRLGFRFTVKNIDSNPVATVTDFSTNEYILLFDAFNSSDDPTGDVISNGTSFDLVFFTTFGVESLNQGVNQLTGTWTLGNTFAGFEDLEETYTININYRVIVAFVNDNSKKAEFGPGKIRADAYIDEYSVLNSRERQSFEGGRAINPG